MNSAVKYSGSLVEYLDRGGLHPGFVVREQGDKLVIRDRGGNERIIARELLMLRHSGPHAEGDGDPVARMAALEEEKAALRAELDLTLLWEGGAGTGPRVQRRGFAELFFGRRCRAQAPR